MSFSTVAAVKSLRAGLLQARHTFFALWYKHVTGKSTTSTVFVEHTINYSLR
ncbi:hypothetical protein Hsw_2490 [Hymenobacter swuensis DY53]|uniref:Uncharacterized protein n=1 Tax=Hymenobacter swuensis DY53 TaxID=1227739 RepID=W8F8P3_9BACT|nr:hypothetical protein Hsw_2490 [Hymenobacter swuensis DY53]